jgi:L-2-hydroxycarboxylate dehydrogenase (NAD+)
VATEITVSVECDRLRGFVASVLERTGLPTEDATVVSDCLVDADLRGIPSHGVSRLPAYIDALRRGFNRPKPVIQVQRTGLATAVLDGGGGIGSLVAVRGMREAIALANESGVGMVTVRGSSPFGHAGYFASLAATTGCIGIVFSNAPPAVAPFGGCQAMFGTNPIAVAAPGGDRPNFVLDMSTSLIARGRLRLASQKNEPIPEGLALTADGSPARTSREALAGILLSFGEHKGSGLGMMIDLIAGVLAGAGYGRGIGSMYAVGEAHADVGHALIAIRISAFLDLSEYSRRYRAWYDALKACAPARGHDAVMIPGERSAALAQRQRCEGIELHPETLRSLKLLAVDLALPFPPERRRYPSGSEASHRANSPGI